MAHQTTLLPACNRPTECPVPLFGPDDLIDSYSRAQAIEDGVLVDVSEVAREAGLRYPVALTRAVWADCVTWTRDDYPQDESGRLWDVVYMLSLAVRASRGGSELRYSIVRVPNEGRGHVARRVSLKSVCGPGDDAEPVITIMQPEED